VHAKIPAFSASWTSGVNSKGRPRRRHAGPKRPIRGLKMAAARMLPRQSPVIRGKTFSTCATTQLNRHRLDGGVGFDRLRVPKNVLTLPASPHSQADVSGDARARCDAHQKEMFLSRSAETKNYRVTCNMRAQEVSENTSEDARRNGLLPSLLSSRIAAAHATRLRSIMNSSMSAC
jgi:hypothetical protein